MLVMFDVVVLACDVPFKGSAANATTSRAIKKVAPRLSTFSLLSYETLRMISTVYLLCVVKVLLFFA